MKIHNKFYFFSILTFAIFSLYGCGSTKEVAIVHPVLGDNEILNSLTQITDNSSFFARSVNGYGENGIIYSLYNTTSGAVNVYKKESPLAPSMVQVTSGENNLNHFPTYCKAIDRIAFSKALFGASSWDLYMMPASSGTALIPITETSGYSEWHPSFSKDGQYVTYQRTTGVKKTNDVSSEIWVKNLKTGENMLLGEGCSPCFSPVDNRIAFAKFGNTTNLRHIWIMNVDGSGATQITTKETGFAGFPCWSPDGKHIVFQNVVNNAKYDFDLCMVDPDGSNLKQLTSNKSEDTLPYWSEDGYIYFISDRGGRSGNVQIWRFKASNF